MKYALWKYPVHFLAYGFGTGLMPFAPGTFGSLVGVVLFWYMSPLGAGTYAAVVALLFVLGIFICGQTARDTAATDPGFIVFDEIVGFLIAMYLMPREWQWIVAGFLIYRLFDIWKPYPIHIVENKFGLGTAIMLDDVIAGIYTLVLLQAARMILDRFVS